MPPKQERGICSKIYNLLCQCLSPNEQKSCPAPKANPMPMQASLQTMDEIKGLPPERPFSLILQNPPYRPPQKPSPNPRKLPSLDKGKHRAFAGHRIHKLPSRGQGKPKAFAGNDILAQNSQKLKRLQSVNINKINQQQQSPEIKRIMLVSHNRNRKGKRLGPQLFDEIAPLQHGYQEKSIPLNNLDNDIIMVGDTRCKFLKHIKSRHQGKLESLDVVQSTAFMKESLQSMSYIKEMLGKLYTEKRKIIHIFFTGHGQQGTGNLYIQTTKNPRQGQILTIEQILSIVQGQIPPQADVVVEVYIDACYSGYNAERAKLYCKKNNMKNVYVYCSCGEDKTAPNTRKGGLLTFWYSRFFRQAQKRLKDLCDTKSKLYQQRKKLFEKGQPVSYVNGKIQRIKFDRMIYK